MALSSATLTAPLEHGMSGDQAAVLQDMDLGGGQLDFHGAPAGTVGHGVEVAANRDHTVARDPALQAEHGVERPGRQRPEVRALFGEVLGNNAPSRGVQTPV